MLRTHVRRLLALAAALLAVPLLAPAPAHAAPPSYVALGDSYSSGVGTRTYLNDGTSCQRSVYAFPSLIAAAKGYALNLRACSGAKVSDVTSTQLSALSASTSYVTISVGGNDAGFTSVITTCAEPAWLSDCNGAVSKAQSYIKNTLPGSLSTLYAAIRARAPHATVVVVGYPRLFNGEDCNALTWFSPSDESLLNATADLINSKLAAAAAAKGFAFANPTSSVHRPRRLRQPGVAQRPVQPDQRELPPQPHRPRLRLHAAGQPAADRRRPHGHQGRARRGPGAGSGARRPAAAVRRRRPVDQARALRHAVRRQPLRRRGPGADKAGPECLARAMPPTSDHKILLAESDLPTRWYNVLHDLPTPPPPVLHPGTGQPVGPEDLAPLFPMALIMQEVSQEQYVEIPGEVLDVYRLWRPSPLFRAHRLEKALGTPARIYYKYEGVSPAGSHKPNTAVPQAFYNKQAGISKLTTETGAGQWGTALAFACSQFDLECEVWQVRASYDQKPYRRMMIETFGGIVHPSPSDLTEAGRSILAQDPDSTGSLGIAISEAVEVAAQRSDTNYALGSVLNHVLLHQTVIGEEALLQLAMVGETPDLLVGCTGGGSNFGGLAFPFLREKWAGRMSPVVRAVEPAACPSLTQGTYAYDFGDTLGMTPLMKMHTLGHDFIPDPIHAGRPALPRHEPADQPPLRDRRARGGRQEAVGVLRRGRAVRPHRGDRPGPRADPRPGRDHRGGAPLHRDGGGEGDPHGAVRSRPPRPGGVRRLPARRGHRPQLGRRGPPGRGGHGPGAAPRAGLSRRPHSPLAGWRPWGPAGCRCSSRPWRRRQR